MESEQLKKLLIAQQDELILRREKIHADFASRHISKDFGQQTKERENDDVLVALDKDAQNELTVIKQALKRVEREDFQHCQQCAHIISDERLQAIPYTSYCRNCAD